MKLNDASTMRNCWSAPLQPRRSQRHVTKLRSLKVTTFGDSPTRFATKSAVVVVVAVAAAVVSVVAAAAAAVVVVVVVPLVVAVVVVAVVAAAAAAVVVTLNLVGYEVLVRAKVTANLEAARRPLPFELPIPVLVEEPSRMRLSTGSCALL